MKKIWWATWPYSPPPPRPRPRPRPPPPPPPPPPPSRRRRRRPRQQRRHHEVAEGRLTSVKKGVLITSFGVNVDDADDNSDLEDLSLSFSLSRYSSCQIKQTKWKAFKKHVCLKTKKQKKIMEQKRKQKLSKNNVLKNDPLSISLPRYVCHGLDKQGSKVRLKQLKQSI